MSWSLYGSFLVFAGVLVLVPGPDFAVVTKNALAAGRRRGVASACGVASSNAVQGAAAAAGLGAVIMRSQPGWPPSTREESPRQVSHRRPVPGSTRPNRSSGKCAPAPVV